MVKDHSDSERGNPLLPHGLLFPINSKGSFISHRQDSTYHSLCYTSRGALDGTRNSSMGQDVSKITVIIRKRRSMMMMIITIISIIMMMIISNNKYDDNNNNNNNNKYYDDDNK